MEFNGQEQQVANSHLEKKNEILDGLVRQVSVVKSFIKKQENLEHSSFETLMPLLEKEHENLFTTFDQTTIEKYKVYKEYLNELKDLDNFSDGFDYENASKEEILEFEEEYDKIQNIYKKCEALLTSDVSFLEHLDTFYTRIKNIAIHNQEIRVKKKSSDDISVYLDEQGSLEGHFLPEDIKEVKEDAFCTTFVINEEAWTKKYDKLLGFYISGTDYTFVKDCNKKAAINETIKHEKTHHLLDGISRYSIYEPTKRVQNIFQSALRLKKMKAPDVIIENRLSMLLGHNAAKKMIDSTQNEFLAEYEEGQRKNFGNTPEIELFELIFGVSTDAKVLRKQRFKTVAKTLSTAGRHILDGHNALKLLALKLEKEGFSEYVQDAKLQTDLFEDMFIKMIEQIKQASKYGAILGEEVDTEIKALIILLKPTSYHHITTYLKHKHSDFIALIEANKSIFINSKIDHLSLRKFCDHIKASSVEIDQNIKDRAYEIIQNTIIGSHESFDDDSLHNPEEAIVLLRELESLCMPKHVELPKGGIFAREYFLETLLPWDPSLESFNKMSDNFFAGEDNSAAEGFIKSEVFENEFDDDQKQKTIIFLKRIGLL